MHIKRSKSTAAFTIVEIMEAMVILLIAMIGASGYRYYAALDARKAAMQATAARIGLLLCESWRGVEGTETFRDATRGGLRQGWIRTIFAGLGVRAELALTGAAVTEGRWGIGV